MLFFRIFQIAIFFVLLGPASAIDLFAQKSEPIQSPFYDAIELLFTSRGYKVYPVFTGTNNGQGGTNATNNTGADVFGDTGGGAGRGAAAPADSLFKLVECGTGKIVLDKCKGAMLLELMNSEYRFADADGLQEAIIDSILARNAMLPGGSPHDQIRKAYDGNTYIDLSPSKNIDAKYLLMGFDDRLPREGGALPKLTTILEGYTEFLIERVNEEINDAFFIHLQEALKKFAELRILFPVTIESLKKIEVTSYNHSLNALKAAFNEDVEHLLSNFTQLATLKKYQDLLTDHPAYTLIFIAADVIEKINQQTPAPQILFEMANQDYVTRPGTNNFSSAVKMAALFSEAARDIKMLDENKEKRGWLDERKLLYLKENAEVFRLYMGLIAQRATGIKFYNNTGVEIFDLKDKLIKEQPEILKGRLIVYNFDEARKAVEASITAIRLQQEKTQKKSDYIFHYIEIANELIGFSEKCLLLLPSKPEYLPVRNLLKTIRTEYVPLARHSCTALSYIADKEYSLALFQVDTLANKVFSLARANAQARLEDAKAKKQSELEKARRKEVDEMDEVHENYIHYGLFITTVASAKTAEDVKNAIKVFALPKGSSRIKKEHHFSWGINSYVGVYHSWNKQYDDVVLPKQETGLFAPIGVGLNFGHFLGAGSISIYGGILDVGAIFSYKVADSSNTIKSDIEFGQILSPSFSVIYGLPVVKKYNIPLSIGASYQWGPRLRKIDDAGNSILPLLARRFQVFAAVDIPIVNFYVSRRK